MKKLLLLVLFAASAVTTMAQSEEKQKASDPYFNQTKITVTAPGTLEQTYYNIEPENIQGLKVTGPLNEADMRFISKLSAPGKLESLHSVNLQDATLDRIPDNCFKGQTYLTNFYFPKNLQEIGDEAFNQTNSLRLADLPEGIKTIGKRAFNGTAIKVVNIPASVDNIGDGAFANLKNLTSVTVDAANTTFGFNNGTLVNTKLKKLLQCFNFLTGTFNVPEDIVSIGDLAFGLAKRLTSIHIPASVKSIGEDAFASTYYLKEIKVDEANTNYTATDGVLFDKNKTVLICYPASKIGTEYTVPSTVTELPLGAFQETGGQNVSKDVKKGLKKVTLPEGLTKIGDYAFTFSGISEINIPSTVKSIGSNCFFYSNIEDITVPEGVTRLEEGTFAYCYSLEKVTLPSTLKYIGANMFCMDDYITEFNIYAQTPPELHSDAFNLLNATSLVLHVVKGRTKAYEKDWDVLSSESVEDDLKPVITAISNTAANNNDAAEVARYDVTGRRIYAPQRGINLIKMSNGKVRKVLVK